MRECVARQVLVPDPTAGIERYVFRHALLQEAVYDDLLPGERTRLHAAFARTLETRSGGDAAHAAELAYHWYAAHDLPRALDRRWRPATAPKRATPFPKRSTSSSEPSTCGTRSPMREARVGRDRIDLLAAAASVARFHEPARAVQQIRTAIGLVDAAPIRSARGCSTNGSVGMPGSPARASWRSEAYRAAMDLIPAEPPTAARARVVAGLAQILMLGGRFAESRPLAEDALIWLARSAPGTSRAMP